MEEVSEEEEAAEDSGATTSEVGTSDLGLDKADLETPTLHVEIFTPQAALVTGQLQVVLATALVLGGRSPSVLNLRDPVRPVPNLLVRNLRVLNLLDPVPPALNLLVRNLRDLVRLRLIHQDRDPAVGEPGAPVLRRAPSWVQ